MLLLASEGEVVLTVEEVAEELLVVIVLITDWETASIGQRTPAMRINRPLR